MEGGETLADSLLDDLDDLSDGDAPERESEEVPSKGEDEDVERGDDNKNEDDVAMGGEGPKFDQKYGVAGGSIKRTKRMLDSSKKVKHLI